MYGRKAVRWLILSLSVAFLSVAPQFSNQSYAAKGDATEAEIYLQDAKKYLKKGDVNAAIIQLKNALQKNPNYVAARSMLARIYLAVGNGPNAEKEVRAVLKRGVGGHKVRFMLAEAFLLQGKFDDVLKEITDDSPDTEIRARALIYRGKANLGLRRLEESEKLFREAARLLLDSPEPRIGLARVLVMRLQLGDAEKEIDGALAVAPNNTDALVLKAQLRRLDRDLEVAVTYFDKAIAAQEKNLPARLGRAAALIDLNKADQAKADLDVVYARFPNHPLASYLSAFMLAKKKDFTGAQEALQQGGRLLDNHLPSLLLSGAVSYALKQTEQAIKSLTRYVRLVPENTRAITLLAAAQYNANQPGKTIELLRPLIDKGTSDTQVLALAGSAYMRTGSFDQGTAMFQKAAEAAPNTAALRTRLAVGRLFSGQSDQALSDLEAAVDLDPGSSRASILLTLVQLRKGKFDDALKSAGTLQGKMPENPMPQYLIGEAYLGKGDGIKARQAFEQALETNPEFHSARMNLAQLDLRENKIKSAVARLEKIIEKNPKHLNAMLALATIAEREKRTKDTLSWLQKASDANPANILPQLRIIKLHSRAREFQKAAAVARELVQNHPRNRQALAAQGRTESAIGDHVAAVAVFKRLTDLAPKSAQAFSLLAGAHIAAKDNDSARQALKKAISLDGNADIAHVALAKLEARTGKTDEALEIAEALQKRKPRSPVGFVLAGDVYLSMKRFGPALEAYRAGQERADTDTLALRKFNVQRLAGRENEAFSDLQTWVDGKDNSAVRFVLASAYINAKQYDNAIRETERLLKKDGSNPVLLNNLAWLYDQKGDEKALGLAEEAYEKAPKSAAIMDTLGWILVRKGRFEDGAKLLEKASELVPDQGDIAYHHAVALNKSGRTREARRKLRKLIGSGIKFSELKEAEALLKELGG